jgi:alkylhydroperoxidase/carboxymuconolactone decarboxylase family protein YurZ
MSRNVKRRGFADRTIAAVTIQGARRTGLWGPALALLEQWDPTWTQACHEMSVHPWRNSVLSDRFAVLVCIALNAACTTLDGEAVRRHIRAALAAGSSRDEIAFVVKCATVVSLHSLSVAAPILMIEAESQEPSPHHPTATPTCDALRAAGQWNTAWDPFVQLDPQWTEEFMTLGADIYSSDVLTSKEIELLSIAVDASVSHMYVPGIRRHIRGALDAGATVEEIVAVLQLCVSQGVQACNLAIPILDEECSLANEQSSDAQN